MSLGPCMFAFTDADGWHAGIGDPTVLGWVTVLAYALAAGICGKTAWDCSSADCSSQKRFWWGLTALLLFLGLNKQLDLQTWLTLAGKRIAQNQGWYEQRRGVQIFFIVAIALGSAGAVWVSWRMVRAEAHELWLPIAGLALLLGFVLIRAASFHHVDQLLHWHFAGVRMNGILELGSIAIIGLGGWLRWPPGHRLDAGRSRMA